MRAQKKMYRHMASWVAGTLNREGFQEEKGQNEGRGDRRMEKRKEGRRKRRGLGLKIKHY